MGNEKERILKKKFDFDGSTLDYGFQLKKKPNLWWLLLILLPLLLLVKCQRTITVECKDDETGKPIEGAFVSLDYRAHFFIDSTGFSPHHDNSYETVTDDKGIAVFDNLECSVFSYIFHVGGKMKVTATADCYEQADTLCKFHCTKKIVFSMRQSIGLPIRIVDIGTLEGIEKATIQWNYNGVISSLVSDLDGSGTLHNVPQCKGAVSRIDATANGYYDTTYYNLTIEDLDRHEAVIKMRPIVEDFHLDIVLCIDNTNSMKDLIDLVKLNALNFHKDLSRVCAKDGKKVKGYRLRVVSFGDLKEKSIVATSFLMIPKQADDFRAFVNEINATGGADSPEDALEALAMAINSDWTKGLSRSRLVMIVYTDASAHDLGFNKTSKYYPKETMPMDFIELTQWWKRLDPKASRLILFAPRNSYWNTINNEWPNVYLKPLKEVMENSSGYNEILEAISNSL